MTSPPIRDAATIILLRDPQSDPKILMGQRGKNAAFMPDKFVFPGGALDPQDHEMSLADPLDPVCRTRLDALGDPLALCAIRELWEETGQLLGSVASVAGPVPQDWQSFVAEGLAPSARAMHYVFRAITPPKRPRRFDARFFMVDARHLASDPDDFSRASDELSHLAWLRPGEARKLNLPFITEVVLAEVEALARSDAPPPSVPFFDNRSEKSVFRRIE